ncbi:diguanylate cyclase [Fulvivirga imtechensis AK7]|uniref:histidine kinase n=1 Tax=Fulvivirga imtechensis AK7 TaxID=1237149 RepID=L8JXS2_9BACT|nr:PAS domain-containing sensor histidine kinase [Fulvivirga imtechensis]ELR72027.1 diguanylate cyclase [Fulvivirga imtechensis AK7]
MGKTDFNYQLLFDLSPDLLCIAGYDGYFKRINPAVSQALGYTMEELYSRPINDFVYDDDKQVTADMRQKLTESVPLLNFENRYITKSGEIVWLAWTAYPVHSQQLIFAIAKNVTHKKREEEKRNSLLANLSQANRDLKQLTYTTSHDLRSPVNNLLAIISLIDISRVKDQKTVELLEILKLSGSKLQQTLNSYVDVLSEKHRLHAAMEEVSFAEILQGVLDDIGTLIRSSNTTIHADFSGWETVMFNRAYLESIFLNLITNAIKYSVPGRPPVVSIYSTQEGSKKQLIVADNGQGFDLEKVKDKIFGLGQKFHQHSDSKGIGLYLVHSHVTDMGGQIHVESRVNEGTKFVITFRD